MPKFDLILIKRKIKTIRASTKEIAEERAKAIVADSDWMVESVEWNALGIEITEE